MVNYDKDKLADAVEELQSFHAKKNIAHAASSSAPVVKSKSVESAPKSNFPPGRARQARWSNTTRLEQASSHVSVSDQDKSTHSAVSSTKPPEPPGLPPSVWMASSIAPFHLECCRNNPQAPVDVRWVERLSRLWTGYLDTETCANRKDSEFCDTMVRYFRKEKRFQDWRPLDTELGPSIP